MTKRSDAQVAAQVSRVCRRPNASRASLNTENDLSGCEKQQARPFRSQRLARAPIGRDGGRHSRGNGVGNFPGHLPIRTLHAMSAPGML